MKLLKEKKKMGKEVIVISTSLRKGSNSDTLADEFILNVYKEEYYFKF